MRELKELMEKSPFDTEKQPNLISKAEILQKKAAQPTPSGERMIQQRERSISWIDQAIGLYDQESKYKYYNILNEEDREERAEMVKSSPNLHFIADAFRRRAETFVKFGGVIKDEDWAGKALESAKICQEIWQIMLDATDDSELKKKYKKNMAGAGEVVENLKLEKKKQE